MKKINSCVQANLINNTITWGNHYDKHEYKFYFPEENLMACLYCFKDYTAWKEKTNKYIYIKNREITSEKPKLKFPLEVKYDKCVICKTDTFYPVHLPIHRRKNYLSGFGQFCPSCYIATTNTSTVMTEFYENYLF